MRMVVKRGPKKPGEKFLQNGKPGVVLRSPSTQRADVGGFLSLRLISKRSGGGGGRKERILTLRALRVTGADGGVKHLG